jgi:3-dehydroquinate synthase
MKSRLTEEVKVELGERSYPITIGTDMLLGLGREVSEFGFSRVMVLSNPTVFPLYGDIVLDSLDSAGLKASVVLIPDGEEYKGLLWTYHIYDEMLKQRLDRASAVIALGGGVIGDIAGFAASTYMRGISFIQVPTTLLAQVDSSVGGKTGVNHPLGKNMIGTFYQPKLVWTDVGTLKTLQRREFLSGIAEVIKYGVIWDEGLFSYLETHRQAILSLDSETLMFIIKRSCEIKSDIVSRDEREAGLRAVLNYGHTIGHAIETATGYTTYLHGEAVAIGMQLEARLSAALGYLDGGESERIRSIIDSYGLPADLPPDINPEVVLSSMELDKKAVAGSLRFVLPERIGAVNIRAVTDRDKIAGSMGLRRCWQT